MNTQFTNGEYQTRDGRKAIVVYDMGTNPLKHELNSGFEPKPLVGWIENWPYQICWGYDGKSNKESNTDLVVSPPVYYLWTHRKMETQEIACWGCCLAIENIPKTYSSKLYLKYAKLEQELP